MNKNNYYYSTGEFAEMAGLNKKTLIYYDEIGLFKPEVVCENGYRYYSAYQMDRLAMIIILRDMGMSLSNIREYLTCGDAMLLDEILLQKEQEIDQMIQTMQRRKKMLREQLESNSDFHKYMNKGYKIICNKADENYDILMDENDLRKKKVVNYITEGEYTGLCLQGDGCSLFRKLPEGALTIPAGEYLYYYGVTDSNGGTSMTTRMDEERCKMQSYASEHHLQLDDKYFVEFNDILSDGEGRDYFCIKAKICTGS